MVVDTAVSITLQLHRSSWIQTLHLCAMALLERVKQAHTRQMALMQL